MNANLKFTVSQIESEFLIIKNSETNKYSKLYLAIKNCIINSILPDNWQLPATRLLAEELQLSRTTVVKAYELLQLENLIIGKTGSGYRVHFKIDITQQVNIITKKVDLDSYPEISENGKSFLENVSLINRSPTAGIAFRPGLPPLDLFPINQWKNLLNSYWRHVKVSTLSYSRSTGIEPLKKEICNYLNVSRGIKCNYRQVMVVSGSLQSLYLIANVLINTGDSVILENPTFPNIYSIFKSMRANLIPTDLDDEGISIKAIKKIKTKDCKLIVTTPSNQYPTSVKMSLQRRMELLEWASKNKTLIIENDFEHEIGNSLEKLPSIFSIDNEDRTIYMGTFNRLLHPSIRLGYMIVPKYLVSAVEALQEHSHRFVPPSIQIVMSEFIKRNYLYQHLKNIIEVAKKRRELFIREISKSNTIVVDSSSFNSLHIVAKFKNSTSTHQEKEIIDKLKIANISVFSLSKCYIKEPKPTGLLFGYSAVREQTIIKKVKNVIEIIG